MASFRERIFKWVSDLFMLNDDQAAVIGSDELMRWYKVDSSAVYAIGYDFQNKVMGIIFHSNPDKKYYCGNADERLFNSWINASSKGRFFHDYVYRRFRRPVWYAEDGQP